MLRLPMVLTDEHDASFRSNGVRTFSVLGQLRFNLIQTIPAYVDRLVNYFSLLAIFLLAAPETLGFGLAGGEGEYDGYQSQNH